jgi:hypothetical protein
VSKVKRLLLKNRNNQQIYETTSGLSLPKFPIITRWGTWVEFVCFISNNFNEIKVFACAISNSENCSYDFLSLFTDDDLIEELKLVKKYEYIAKTITKLENESLSTEEQIIIYKMLLEKLKMIF